mmetsp:Transcript_26965/g.66757  ORF Transcript_26965/g.66757 Transcript_26965/m.66757 type:complete len:218 (+) Transcript_26965:722-1375(+)
MQPRRLGKLLLRSIHDRPKQGRIVFSSKHENKHCDRRLDNVVEISIRGVRGEQQRTKHGIESKHCYPNYEHLRIAIDGKRKLAKRRRGCPRAHDRQRGAEWDGIRKTFQCNSFSRVLKHVLQHPIAENHDNKDAARKQSSSQLAVLRPKSTPGELQQAVEAMNYYTRKPQKIRRRLTANIWSFRDNGQQHVDEDSNVYHHFPQWGVLKQVYSNSNYL